MPPTSVGTPSTSPSLATLCFHTQSRYSSLMSSAPSVLRSTKFCGCSTNCGRLSPWMSTRSGTFPPASAVVSDWAVSVEVPTSVSLIWMSGRFAWYASTVSFWLMAENDQNSKDLPSPPPPPPVPGVQAVRRARTAAARSRGERSFTTLLQGVREQAAPPPRGGPPKAGDRVNRVELQPHRAVETFISTVIVSAHDSKLHHRGRQEPLYYLQSPNRKVIHSGPLPQTL